MSDKIKNVFVSHHHKDDASVDGLTDMSVWQRVSIKE